MIEVVILTALVLVCSAGIASWIGAMVKAMSPDEAVEALPVKIDNRRRV